MKEPVSVIMRCHNDMPLLAQTLAMLEKQDHPYRLIALDNASTDGSRQELKRYAHQLVHIPAGEYVPGRVLNQGVALAQSDIVVFLNSDCTPLNERWLSNLLAGFADERVGAVFGRQMPRPDCLPWYARDTEETYGDGRNQARWRHCFSLASSALRRSLWEALPFDESLQYSEDIDMSWRLRQAGYDIRYVADSVVVHSHNYTLKQFWKRHYGEGMAEAQIFEWSPWQRHWLRYSLMPFVRQVERDVRWCAERGLLRQAWQAPGVRLAQMLGRRAGFQHGLLRKLAQADAVPPDQWSGLGSKLSRMADRAGSAWG